MAAYEAKWPAGTRQRVWCYSAWNNGPDAYVERPDARAFSLKSPIWTVQSYVRPMSAVT